MGIPALFATMLQSGALGALLTLSHRPWYPFQSAGAVQWGITPLADQQFAGLIMWVGGGIVQFVPVNVLVFLWMRANEQYGRRAGATQADRPCRRGDPSLRSAWRRRRGRWRAARAIR